MAYCSLDHVTSGHPAQLPVSVQQLLLVLAVVEQPVAVVVEQLVVVVEQHVVLEPVVEELVLVAEQHVVVEQLVVVVVEQLVVVVAGPRSAPQCLEIKSTAKCHQMSKKSRLTEALANDIITRYVTRLVR